MLVQDAQEQPGKVPGHIHPGSHWPLGHTTVAVARAALSAEGHQYWCFDQRQRGFQLVGVSGCQSKLWHTWEIVKHKIRKHWNEVRSCSRLRQYSAHDVMENDWRNSSLLLLLPLSRSLQCLHNPSIDHRPVPGLRKCRQAITGRRSGIAPSMRGMLSTLCVVRQCSVNLRQLNATFDINDRSLRFVQRIEIDTWRHCYPSSAEKGSILPRRPRSC